MQMGCGREPKAILLARVAVAKRIAIRQCIPDNIHSKAILFLLSTPSVTLRVPPPSLMEAMFALIVLQNSRGEIPLPSWRRKRLSSTSSKLCFEWGSDASQKPLKLAIIRLGEAHCPWQCIPHNYSCDFVNKLKLSINKTIQIN